jgi:DNA phosphorothioation-dependent restriction protein DptF
LDQFILNRTLDIEDVEYKKFRVEARDKFKIDSRGKVNAKSLVRQLYLLHHSPLENKYPNNFKHSFNDPAEQKYREMWLLHNNYNGDSGQKKTLRNFYDDIVFAAINRYANRNAPFLSKDEFYLSSHGGCDIASEVELSVSYKTLENERCDDIHIFHLHLEANDQLLDPVPINVNLLALLMAVVGGYRPNKYDKNSVVLLDELVNHITSKVSQSDILFLFKGGKRLAKMRNTSDGDIRVSGL